MVLELNTSVFCVDCLKTRNDIFINVAVNDIRSMTSIIVKSFYDFCNPYKRILSFYTEMKGN